MSDQLKQTNHTPEQVHTCTPKEIHVHITYINIFSRKFPPTKLVMPKVTILPRPSKLPTSPDRFKSLIYLQVSGEGLNLKFNHLV